MRCFLFKSLSICPQVSPLAKNLSTFVYAKILRKERHSTSQVGDETISFQLVMFDLI